MQFHASCTFRHAIDVLTNAISEPYPEIRIRFVSYDAMRFKSVICKGNKNNLISVLFILFIFFKRFTQK